MLLKYKTRMPNTEVTQKLRAKLGDRHKQGEALRKQLNKMIAAGVEKDDKKTYNETMKEYQDYFKLAKIENQQAKGFCPKKK